MSQEGLLYSAQSKFLTGLFPGTQSVVGIERGAGYLGRASRFSNLNLLPSIFEQRLERGGLA